MRVKILIAAGLFALAGCAVKEEGLEPPRAPGDVIRFTAGRCFGACPAYSVQVSPDGSGLLEPERFTSVPGPTRFTVTAAQYRRLIATLAPHRPAAGATERIAHGSNCERFATDMPSYVVEWSRPGQASTRLEYQSGCMDARYGRLRVAIASVPKILDVQHMLNPKAVTP
ncbi:MAG TPA: hypothetical protein DCG90_06885 [Sphingobium sp.]|jgi:hypothetical protein|uniref:DUF6438 domain-containing protein n=1 Tax=unclassified Sphingobium TaxID=2611147 RepID=UPI0007F45F5B|nr:MULTISPECIES: DUF6438 domain-containing protein [unclassified Sphingobium]OAN55447.1 hypothetical protein A7Q26_20930 [Sphingobium sp. TCM1]WIW88855.1 DUF6438 domain-containing protein [Sphingobium sp. V4]HAF41474.1 hypothetical protein [Sphingobium sp.]